MLFLKYNKVNNYVWDPDEEVWVPMTQPGGGSGEGVPGGASGRVQYNDDGDFGGISGATTDGTTLTLVAPILGTPASATLTNASGLPIATGVSGLATGVATFLATPSSANLITAVTDETGTGVLVFGTSPTITTPVISGAISLPDNVRQVFNPGANAAGLNVGAVATDPDTPVNGDLWYNSGDDTLIAWIDGAPVEVGAGSAGSVDWGDIGGDITNQIDLQNALDEKAPLEAIDGAGIIFKDSVSSNNLILVAAADGSVVRAASNKIIGWSSNTDPAAGGFDTGLERQSVGFLGVRRGSGAVEETGAGLGVLCNNAGDGAAGFFAAQDLTGTWSYIWPDAEGVWRVGDAPPSEDGAPSDTSGDVLGGNPFDQELDISCDVAFNSIAIEPPDIETNKVFGIYLGSSTPAESGVGQHSPGIGLAERYFEDTDKIREWCIKAQDGSIIFYHRLGDGEWVKQIDFRSDQQIFGNYATFTGIVRGAAFASDNTNKAFYKQDAPTISSGFGTDPSIISHNGTIAFSINVGSGGTATSGEIAMPNAETGWIAQITNLTATAANRAGVWTVQTATTTTSITIESQTIATGTVAPWEAGDVLLVTALGY